MYLEERGAAEMTKIRMAGLCVVAAIAASAVASVSASAALPELGRCEKVGTTGGAYKYKNCVIAAPANSGAFEWRPGPGAKPKFTAETGTVVLETVGHAKVTCTFGTVSGEWMGPKTANVNLSFSACQNSAKKTCQTSPTTGASIQTEQPLTGELGFIHGGEKPTVGLDLKPTAPATTLLTFTCGGPPETSAGEVWAIEGSVIGQEKVIDTMTPAFKLLYKAVGGKQVPEQFESGVKDTLIANRTAGVEPPKSEQAGLTINGPEKAFIAAENEEPLEIKAK
jgi:hypothetical protein